MKRLLFLFFLFVSCGNNETNDAVSDGAAKELELEKMNMETNSFNLFSGGGHSFSGYVDPMMDPNKNVIPMGIGGSFVASFDGKLFGWNKGRYPNAGGDVSVSNNFQYIIGNQYAFAALDENGKIFAWGNSNYGGINAPEESGFKTIAATYKSFAAIDSNNALKCWGRKDKDTDLFLDCEGMPTDSNYMALFGNRESFTALRNDLTVSSWGSNENTFKGVPTDSGYFLIASALESFAGVKNDGTVSFWGNYIWDKEYDSSRGKIKEMVGNRLAYAALTDEFRIVTFGNQASGGKINDLIKNDRFTKIAASSDSFAAINFDQELRTWSFYDKVDHSPKGKFVSVVGNGVYSFAAISTDGRVFVWGEGASFGSKLSLLPNDLVVEDENATAYGIEFVKVVANGGAFAAMSSTGDFYSWGKDYYGGGNFVLRNFENQ